MVNRYYSGPSSDHFDGDRLFNPHHPNTDRSLIQPPRWRFGSKRAALHARIPGRQVTPEWCVEGLRITKIGHATALIQRQHSTAQGPGVVGTRQPVCFRRTKAGQRARVAFKSACWTRSVRISQAQPQCLLVCNSKGRARPPRFSRRSVLRPLVFDDRGKVIAANPLIEAMTSEIRWLAPDRPSLTDRNANLFLRAAIELIDASEGATARSFPVRGADGSATILRTSRRSACTRAIQGVSVAQASRDLDVHENVLRKLRRHLPMDLRISITRRNFP